MEDVLLTKFYFSKKIIFKLLILTRIIAMFPSPVNASYSECTKTLEALLVTLRPDGGWKKISPAIILNHCGLITSNLGLRTQLAVVRI